MTTQDIAGKIIAHLKGEISETQLVDWAENAVVKVVESDIEQPNEQVLLDILMYIGAGDNPDFPLTWEILSGFLEQLGTRVQVVAEMI